MKARKTVKLVVEIAVAVVLVLDLALAAGVIWLSSRVDSERQQRSAMRVQVSAQQALLTSLQRTVAMLPETEDQLKEFLDDHVPSRREGSSRATRLIWLLQQKSGVQLNGVSFKPEKRVEDEPLARLAVDVGAEGPFASLINFAHRLETATDLIILRGLTFNPGENGKLALHISGDFYIAP